MKKIGYLTVHDTINFGSQLQMLSLYKAIESLGHNVTLIDYKCAVISQRESTLPLSEAKNPKDILKSLILHGNLKKRKNSFWKYIDDHIDVTKPFTQETIVEANDIFDTFIVGSDVVWGFNITGTDYTYMLDFADDSKTKLAFSSSVGTRWNDKESTNVKHALSRFDDFTVREKDASDWIGDLLGRSVDVTCDPTLLWDKNFWVEFVGDCPAPKNKYVLVYMSDTENKCVKSAIQYGKEHHMPVYYINFRAPVFGTIDKRPTTLQEWLTLFMHAEVVFSASYHGLLFSTYFERQVFYFNWTNKSRMNSLAQFLGIESREATPANIAADIPIHYDMVRNREERLREFSWKRLRRMLE